MLDSSREKECCRAAAAPRAGPRAFSAGSLHRFGYAPHMALLIPVCPRASVHTGSACPASIHTGGCTASMRTVPPDRPPLCILALCYSVYGYMGTNRYTYWCGDARDGDGVMRSGSSVP